MSKGKEFPPRLVVPRDEVNAEGGFGTYFAVWTPADPFVVHPTEDIEYLSSAEHSHLLAEARRQARVEAFREADALIANEFLADQSTIRREAARRARNVLKARAAKAAEGANE